jgi:drug/metabolite transporter (DMT)-like permease
VGEWGGVSIALVSSCLGGTAAAITRYLVGNADPITLAILRWAIGFACVLPAALVLRAKWPARPDWPAVALLGLCFFGLFFVLYNIAIGYTTAARASLALATLPLHTMVVGALLGVEPLTVRKSAGVGVAVLGVVAALAYGLSAAPAGAWRGELIMTGAVLCMAFYNVLSRPFIRRSSALGFLSVGMGAGAAGLIAVGSMTGSVAVLGSFGAAQWIAGIYLNSRRRAGVHPVGAGAGARDANPRGEHHDRQPDRGGFAGHATGRRADHAQSRHRTDRGIRGHLACDVGGQSVRTNCFPGSRDDGRCSLPTCSRQLQPRGTETAGGAALGTFFGFSVPAKNDSPPIRTTARK